MRHRKLKLFVPIFAMLLLADCGTKQLAVDRLEPHVPHEVVGDVVRFTLGYNPGAAFGITAGDGSRWVFTVLAAAALLVIAWLYRDTRPDNVLRTAALGLVFGGAIGNLYDRLRSARGVVDFIDVGVGDLRWWTFNVADAGIVVGGLILAWQVWREEAQQEAQRASDGGRASG